MQLNSLPSFDLFTVLPEGAGDSLLRQLFVQQFGDLVGFQVILSLLADHRYTDCFDEPGGLHAAGAALHAGKAGQAGPQGLRFHQLIDLAFSYHGDELMGMNVHLVESRAGTGALAAFHAFTGVDPADPADGLRPFLIRRHQETLLLISRPEPRPEAR